LFFEFSTNERPGYVFKLPNTTEKGGDVIFDSDVILTDVIITEIQFPKL